MVNTRVNKGLEVHSPLSFRNEDDSLKSWKINDRSKSPRQRRSQPSNELDDEQDKSDDEFDDEEGLSSELSAHRDDTSSEGAFKDVSDDGSEVSGIDDDTDDVVKLVRNKRNNNNLRIEKGNDESNDSSRSRRDTIINCGSNVNSKARQLNIGCADESKIDVVPQCNNEGEEGKQKKTRGFLTHFKLVRAHSLELHSSRLRCGEKKKKEKNWSDRDDFSLFLPHSTALPPHRIPCARSF